MTFNPNARTDPRRVRTRGGGKQGTTLVVGGGGIGALIILAVILLTGGDPSQVPGLTEPGAPGAGTAGAPDVSHCVSGAAANEDVNCRIVATAHSLDQIWSVALPHTGLQYEPPGVTLFTASVGTACGNATSAVGPFYCPADQTTYFDTSFFDVLSRQFGASSGPLAQQYVVAHEFGHHIQHLMGDLDRSRTDPRGPGSGAVRTELQADCYAGLWAHHADKTPMPGETAPYLLPLTAQDIADALSAAEAVGDDRIQHAATGQVNPESWTHGSAEQRQRWFTRGYETGSIAACDTFSAPEL
ncbi:neutral zinc metallopeptidase [Hoyosella sp. YIM 151337]|uniref:KPN_02809 family neutral zinc metallopeptidase n=1 Tax=Hoyosella sp. YIM 151337 TaxID=2992742 RepID=UPI00223671CE|nr:neutral zinc metallopeptidase [Hoyosella sp. YIM 151337]MCW4353237.1 neutral zinc metallopeptidase [Hoyosella sp. YIM 151337]